MPLRLRFREQEIVMAPQGLPETPFAVPLTIGPHRPPDHHHTGEDDAKNAADEKKILNSEGT